MFEIKNIEYVWETGEYLLYTSNWVKADKETSCLEETYPEGASVPEN